MKYKTKDSGKREQYSSGMVRDTQEGKLDYWLVPQDIIHQFVVHFYEDNAKMNFFYHVFDFLVTDDDAGYYDALSSFFYIADDPYELMERMAGLMTRGAEKYGRRNWEKASTEEELERFKSSCLRHLFQFMCGEEDEDHLCATMFNLCAVKHVQEKL